jgi:purine-nucleoside phosphorylase
VALVLGSGLGDFADGIKQECVVPYSDIAGFPESTVPGHAGCFNFGYLGDVKVVCMKGRVHYYEGYPISDVVMGVRLMCLMGAKTVLLTNASGGINSSFKAGDFMILKDHISCFAPNPLIGPNVEQLGTRFPDMSHVYDEDLRQILKDSAKELSVDIKEGVYVQLTGPSFESPAEIQMLKTLGADAVGMSTVVEAICANHMGRKVAGVSRVCNMAEGIQKPPPTHDDVQAAAAEAAPKFKALITRTIEKIGEMK